VSLRLRSGGGGVFAEVGQENVVAKGQKKSNREIRKPKKEKPKPAVAAASFMSPQPKKK
jgi:hypothetical protein